MIPPRDVVMRADGSWEPIEPKNGRDYKLAELTSLINDGYVQMVLLKRAETLMFVDEEGLRKQLPFNPTATEYARQYGRDRSIVIVGDAVVCQIGRVT